MWSRLTEIGALGILTSSVNQEGRLVDELDASVVNNFAFIVEAHKVGALDQSE